MNTITVGKLREFLDMIPDVSPVYVIGENGENGRINIVRMESMDVDDFEDIVLILDYEI